MVEADNYIFPDCLDLMVRAFERSESIGLASSYCLIGDKLEGSGYPYPMTPAMLLGKRMGSKQYLRGAPLCFWFSDYGDVPIVGGPWGKQPFFQGGLLLAFGHREMSGDPGSTGISGLFIRYFRSCEQIMS